MTTRPSHIAQTSTEAKKLHKRNGLGIPERQRRQLERAAELEERASRIREAEQRRKEAKKKREEREKKERAARKQVGVGLATQLIGYSHTQAQLKSGMEAFLGLKKKQAQDQDIEMTKKLEAIVEEVAKEPWDDDGDEDAFDLPELSGRGSDQWIDDEVDDDSLLEVHDLIMSDPPEDVLEAAEAQISPPPPTVRSEPTSSKSKEDPDFVRLHGPVNKAIESLLENLPEPLIELLSQDFSVNTDAWNPALSLLHKLNPIGLPPHRLRIKVGCAVTLLRDLNSSSQLSKSQHLQILRAEKERLECLILDGQLEGTKTFLTRVAFPAKHRNDETFVFQRIQFPIQVAKDYIPSKVAKAPSQASFKIPSMSGQATRPTSSSSKKISPAVSQSRPKTTVNLNPNPSFKRLGLPASKSKPPAPQPSACIVLDGWDDFLDSGTQIARELSSEPSPSPAKPLPQAPTAPLASISNSLPPLSTQDLDFSLEDLNDSPPPSRPSPKKTRETTQKPSKNMVKLVTPTIAQKPASIVNAMSPKKHAMAPPPRPPQNSNSKRKSPRIIASHDLPPLKRSHIIPAPRTPRKAKAPSVKAFTSFHDFGLSTQEAASFFDDDEDLNDELAFGSPPIAV